MNLEQPWQHRTVQQENEYHEKSAKFSKALNELHGKIEIASLPYSVTRLMAFELEVRPILDIDQLNEVIGIVSSFIKGPVVLASVLHPKLYKYWAMLRESFEEFHALLGIIGTK